MSKYNQQSLDDLTNFFSINLNSCPFRVYQSGTYEGQVHISKSRLMPNQVQLANDFCMRKFDGTGLKNVQRSFNLLLKKGTIKAKGFENDTYLKEVELNADEPITEDFTPTDSKDDLVNTIVRLSRYVADNVMSRKDFDEVISNLYD